MSCKNSILSISKQQESTMFLSIAIALYIIIFMFFYFTPKKNVKHNITITDTYYLRGFSILFIVFHHISQRISYTNILIKPFIYFVYLFVGLFFFLSGYGNYISLSRKKESPTRWLIKRILNLVIFFIIGLILNLLINHELYQTPEIFFIDLITFTYNPYTLWFFKVLLVLYIISYILDIIKISDKTKIILLFVIVFFYILLCNIFKVGDYWWNSIIAYPLGIFIAWKPISKVAVKKVIMYMLLFSITCVLGLKYILFKPISLFFFLIIVTNYFYIFSFDDKKNVLHTFIKNMGKISLGIYLYHTIFLTLLASKIDNWYNN